MKIKQIFNLAKLGILTLGLFISSCSNEDFDESINNSNQLEKKSFMGETIFVASLGNGEYLSGDTKYFEEQFDSEGEEYNSNPTPGEEINKLGVAPGITKWPNNTIIYVLDNSLTSNQINVTRSSMEVWSSQTNIRFKERTTENFYVTILNDGQDCNCGRANLGVNGNRGTITIGTRTTNGVMIHEIGHTLGYIHEQNRSDRDQFVRIFPENIQDGAISQFRITTNSVNPGTFDVNSTMIYSSFTFSKNGQEVMLQLDGSRIPFRNGLSAGDIAGTNQVYPANNTDPDPDPTDDICDGIDEWVRGQQYNVGDQVTFQGSLFERDFTRWNRLGACGEEPVEDICEGVEPFNGNNNSYSAGDRVTFRGSLYERLSNGRWTNLGECDN